MSTRTQNARINSVRENRDGTMSIRVVCEFDLGLRHRRPVDYEPCPFEVGQSGVLCITTYVGPNQRDHEERGGHMGAHLWDGPVPGNSDNSVERYHGWRGTTNDWSNDAYGEREVTRIREFRNGWQVYFSRDRKRDEA